jgi:hypothetical protein
MTPQATPQNAPRTARLLLLRATWIAFALAAIAAVMHCGSDSSRKLATCDGKEVDLDTDRAHCGACGVVCPLTRTCFDGVCGCQVIACSACDPICRHGTKCVDGSCERDPDASQ